MILNINPARYAARYLAEPLSPLSWWEFAVKNSEELSDLIRQKYIPNNYNSVSFDVKLLFTNVPLDTTVNVIARHNYEEKINWNTSVKIQKTWIFYAKNIHFINFDNEIYSQADDAAMGSPLGSIFAGTIMVQLVSLLK